MVDWTVEKYFLMPEFFLENHENSTISNLSSKSFSTNVFFLLPVPRNADSHQRLHFMEFNTFERFVIYTFNILSFIF